MVSGMMDVGGNIGDDICSNIDGTTTCCAGGSSNSNRFGILDYPNYSNDGLNEPIELTEPTELTRLTKSIELIEPTELIKLTIELHIL